MTKANEFIKFKGKNGEGKTMSQMVKEKDMDAYQELNDTVYVSQRIIPILSQHFIMLNNTTCFSD